MPRIQGQLSLEIADGFRHTRLIQMQLPEKKVRQRKPGIERDRLLRVLFSDRIELLPQQHARSKKIRRRRLRLHVKHARERLPRLGIIPGLYIAEAEDVRGIHICPRMPPLKL